MSNATVQVILFHTETNFDGISLYLHRLIFKHKIN
jgi:hypothetical protein